MKYQLEPQLNTPDAQKLYEAIAQCSTPFEVAELVRDLLTIEELEEAIRRFKVARMLNDGKTFRTIAAEVKTSSATVSRVNYWLHHGANGYRLALKRLAKTTST